jgi:hypothetical protein
MFRHLKQCITSNAETQVGPPQGVMLMRMLDAFYRSAACGRSVEVR